MFFFKSTIYLFKILLQDDIRLNLLLKECVPLHFFYFTGQTKCCDKPYVSQRDDLADINVCDKLGALFKR